MMFDNPFSTRYWWTVLSVGLLAVALVFTGCDSNGGNDSDPEPEPEPEVPTTLTDVVTDTDNLSTLATALEETERTETLDDTSETFTVFAPSNDAFEAYDVDFLLNNSDLLGSVLDYHVVQGSAVTADDLEDGDTFETVQGDEIEVRVDDDGDVFVEGAPVTTADVEADNGVAHVVGDVLLTNRTAGERLQVTTEADSLYEAVDNAGLASAFNDSENTWTTFAPDNAAFENAELSGFSDSEIQQILQYHTLDGVTDAEALVQLLSDNDGEVSIPTNQGEDLKVTQVEPDSIVFNDGEAALNLNRVDQRASNGIIHQIDGVLLPPSFNKSVRYDLEAQSNDGAISEGVSGTVTFWELDENRTVVTLSLDDGATDTDVAHPAHIHENSASEGGDISIYLTPIDGSGGEGTSARIVNRPFDELANFDGYVNVHESVSNLGTVVSQGNVGANADGMLRAGLDLVDSPRTMTYTLDANDNDGNVAPNGIAGSATFIELTSGQTFVQVSLDPETDDGSTGASVSHPAHIHNNAASEGGQIEYYLSPVDGSDAEARSGKIVGESFDTLEGFNGHINVHESVANLQYIVSQGDVGTNASGN